MLELTLCERRRLANLRWCDFWGPPLCRAPLVVPAVGAVAAAPAPPTGSRAIERLRVTP
jgi:hypothetical protein